ncbi:MAG: Gar1/Naf1 family protein [Methanothrix sp.]|nr:Gar1/Naf1 family protein [Methanothrix sp.]MDD4093489.1 Gar1/Naf1 family protein [Methanothrix sp.]MDD4580176.1 Gar1/Naf1 family protein [Methanothrix sp.]
MKRLGTALHVVQNKLIVQSEQVVGSETSIPRTNSWVVDQKRTRVGKVLDIFGPINRPYIIVRPNRDVDAAAHVGKKLYIDEAPGRDSKWKRLRS